LIMGLNCYSRLFAAALVVAALLYVNNLDGGFNRFTYDSFRYLAGAESIIASGSYLDISGEPQRVWPPGTSLTLAGIMLVTEFDHDGSTQVMGLISTLVAAISLWTILRRAIERQWLVVMAFAAFVLNTGFLSLQQKLLSDPMALAMAIGSISCAIIASDRKNPNWFLWFLSACLLISLAIGFRFAMIGAIPILCAVGFWRSRHGQSHRYAVLLPLLSPFTLIVCLAVLNVPILEQRVSDFQSLDLSDDLEAVIRISDQFLPTSIVPKYLALLSYLVFVIIVPLLSAIKKGDSIKRSTIFISVGFILSFGTFILLSQSIAIPSFEADFRILLPLLPFSLISLAVATELLMSKTSRKLQFLSYVLLCILMVTTVRAVRAATLTGLVAPIPQMSRRFSNN